jgi:hypothetical protein
VKGTALSAGLLACLATGLPQAQPAPKAVVAGPALSVNVATGRRAISADIYGMNFADEAMATELRVPVNRRGGNSTTRYNWQVDTFNTGSDYYFENIPEANPNVGLLPNGSAADRFVEQNRRTATRTIMTMPLIGWVAKRRLENHPYDCGFKVSKYGAQQSVDPYDTDCGNGVLPTSVNIAGNNPTDTSVAVGPSFVSAWVAHLTGNYGTAANGGVTFYALDNEPALWNSTHRDVHPSPITYDEIRDRGYQYGAAIKAADPTAKVLGPVEWGWCGYIYSASDPGGCSIGPDYIAHGNTPFVVWYLQQMRAYELANSQRILDYLDLHFYPQQAGVALQPAGNAATQALRLRSTRALWDPTYIDESYISDLAPGGIAIQMIPRMKGWVDANYPGTKLAFTEYNFGGLENINGALAQAEVLGIFGREGLDLATIWSPPATGDPGAYAFRMYRNYDGAGNGFGETSVSATSADPSSLSVFAAQRTADSALTLIAINKSGNDLASTVSLAGFTPQSPAAVYRYDGITPGAITRPANQALSAGGFSATFPANSITLFVIAPAAGNVSLSLSSASVDAGSVAVGLSSLRTLTLSNTGGGMATLQFSFTGRDFALDAPTTTCGASLAGGASCTLGLRFTPTALGARSASLVIASNAPGSPTTASLAGVGLTGAFANTVSAVITGYYETILARSPDAGGLAFWQGEVTRMGALGASVNEVFYSMALAFFNSPEYTGRNTSDTQYLTDLYNTFFVRAPDAGGLAFWQSQLNGGEPRLAVLNSFLFSPEFQAFMNNAFGSATTSRAEVSAVIDFYRGLLGRLPDSSGFNFWLGIFRAAQCQGAGAVSTQANAISQQFAGGAEYAARDQGRPANLRNALYVADLYNAFLKRPVDLSGFQFWTSQLAGSSETREQVRFAFVASPEFQGRVAAVIAQGCLP